MSNNISYCEIIKKYAFLSQWHVLLWCPISLCQWYHSLNVNDNMGIHSRLYPLSCPYFFVKSLIIILQNLFFISSLVLFLSQFLPHFKLSPILPQLSPGLLSQLSSIKENSKTLAWNRQALYDPIHIFNPISYYFSPVLQLLYCSPTQLILLCSGSANMFSCFRAVKSLSSSSSSFFKMRFKYFLC